MKMMRQEPATASWAMAIVVLVGSLVASHPEAQAQEGLDLLYGAFSHPAFGDTERLDLAEAYLSLYDGGFPGPEIDDIGTAPVLAPLVLLRSIGLPHRGSGYRGAELRACVFVARYLRLHLLANGERTLAAGDSSALSLLAEAVQGCEQEFKVASEGDPQFCPVLALKAARAQLPVKLLESARRLCGPVQQALFALEQAIYLGEEQLPTIPVLEPATWFERHYAASLAKAERARRELYALAAACNDKGDCEVCQLAMRGFYTREDDAMAGQLLKRTISDQGTGACLREAAAVLAWRQDWGALDEVVGGLPEPVPPWARRLNLYAALVRGTLGNNEGLADPALLLAELYGEQPGYVVRELAVWGLGRLADVFQGHADAALVVEQILEQGRRPEIRAGLMRTFSLLLTFLSALTDDQTTMAFMDDFLSDRVAAWDCETVTEAAFEVLAIAAKQKDADRLQQALVLLGRARETCTDPARIAEIEAIKLFAGWADLRLSNRPKDALVELKNRSRQLVLRLPKGVRESIRSMTVLNLLAAILATRQEAAPNIPSFLEDVHRRGIQYHVLWVYHLTQQRRRTEAYAVSRLCELVANRPEEQGGCLLWQAWVHDLSGRRSLADSLEKLGGDLIPPGPGVVTDRYVVCMLGGSRKVKLSFDWSSDFRVESAWIPDFSLLLLPQKLADE